VYTKDISQTEKERDMELSNGTMVKNSKEIGNKV
jgi:hypothetical protein